MDGYYILVDSSPVSCALHTESRPIIEEEEEEEKEEEGPFFLLS
jgi:hypothetical protein